MNPAQCLRCEELLRTYQEGAPEPQTLTRRLAGAVPIGEHDLYVRIWNEARDYHDECEAICQNLLLHFQTHAP